MRKLFYSLLILSVCSAASYAEFFYLKSGKVVSGKIVSETDNSVTVAVSGTGVKRKIMLYEIEEITKNPKPVPSANAKTEEAQSAETAKTQFTSDLKQEKGGETYVKDNESGVLVFNVKETVVEKPKASSAQPAAEDEEFDAALFLLGGGGSSQSPAAKESVKAVPNRKEAPKKQESAAQNDDDFDAALFLLGGGSSKTPAAKESVKAESGKKEEPKKQESVAQDDDDFDAALFLLSSSETPAADPLESEEKTPKSKQPKSSDEYYDSALFSLDEQASKDTTVQAKQKSVIFYDKPANETFLAISFDVKGSNIFSGSKQENGVKSGADRSEDADYGISLSAEQYGYVSRLAAAGVGIGFQFKRCLEKSPGRFGFLPLYAAFKMRFISEEDYHVYGVAHFGYNFLLANYSYMGKSDSKGGLYYAGGIGASYNKYVFQVLYSVNNASIKYSNSFTGDKVDKDVMYSKIGLYVGYLL
jgi:hypothetical protein